MKTKRSFLSCIPLLIFILFCNDVKSIPALSFLITPAGINSTAYTNIRSVYKIESSDEDFTLPATANQQNLSIKNLKERTEILISTGDSLLTAEKDLTPFLRNTPFLNTDKESIRKTALKFRKSADPVKDVSVFVYNHISDKKLGIPLLPASMILTGKAGDCTEHSILTVSLLRTLGIPSRAVMGVILSEDFSGEKDVFVYHMWVEALKDGRWILVDATRPHDFYPNRYIALAYHNLMTEMPIDYLRAVSAIQEMKITFIK
jgi:transglutaminase-like putative cysteine protease